MITVEREVELRNQLRDSIQTLSNARRAEVWELFNEVLPQSACERCDHLIDVLDEFAHAAHAVLEGDSYVGTTPEQVAANRHRLAVFAGKWDRPVTSR